MIDLNCPTNHNIAPIICNNWYCFCTNMKLLKVREYVWLSVEDGQRKDQGTSQRTLRASCVRTISPPKVHAKYFETIKILPWIWEQNLRIPLFYSFETMTIFCYFFPHKFQSFNSMTIAPISTRSENKRRKVVTRTDHINRAI